MYPANQRNTFVMLALFVAISTLKHFEAFDTAGYVLYEYPKL